MIKKTLCILLLITLIGCTTVTKDKIDTIAETEIKKEYQLPALTDCTLKEKLEDYQLGTLKDYFEESKLLRDLLRQCNGYNVEKKEWIERNFKKEK